MLRLRVSMRCMCHIGILTTRLSVALLAAGTLLGIPAFSSFLTSSAS